MESESGTVVASLPVELSSSREGTSKKLKMFLGPEFISSRPGTGGKKLSYVKGNHIFRLANEIFGFDGWSSELKRLDVDDCSRDSNGRWSAIVSAVVRITVKDYGRGEVYHKDFGQGNAENLSSRSQVLEKAKKEAVTDATVVFLSSANSLDKSRPH